MIWGYFVLFFLSMVKFIFSPFLALAVPDNSWYITYAVVTLGGIVGCSFFYFSAGYFMERAAKKNANKVRKKFTKTNKTIVKIKDKIGVYGLAILTASVISIPIGSIITAKFYRHEKKTIFILYGTISVIAAILTFAAYVF